jgi:hypothetical protein
MKAKTLFAVLIVFSMTAFTASAQTYGTHAKHGVYANNQSGNTPFEKSNWDKNRFDNDKRWGNMQDNKRKHHLKKIRKHNKQSCNKQPYYPNRK